MQQSVDKNRFNFRDVFYNEKYKLRQYLIALRPWSFSASLTPVALGACVAYKAHGAFDFFILFTVCITALAVHAAGNLVNTYYDYMKGVDTKKSDDKTLVEGRMSSVDVVTLGAACYAIGCMGLMTLCFISPAKQQLLSLVYFCGLSGSFLYTGGLGLKYVALGDIVIFLIFGPVTVIFAYLALTGELSLSIVPYAIPMAMNIELILHTNNCRDKDSDRLAGIVTLAILLGDTLSYVLFCVLLFGPYIVFVHAMIHYSGWFVLPAATILSAFSLERSFRSGYLRGLPQQAAKLNLILGFTFVAAILLTNKKQLPLLYPSA